MPAVVSWIVPVVEGQAATMSTVDDVVDGGGGGDLLDVVEVLAGKVQELPGTHVDHGGTWTVHVVARMAPA